MHITLTVLGVAGIAALSFGAAAGSIEAVQPYAHHGKSSGEPKRVEIKDTRGRVFGRAVISGGAAGVVIRVTLDKAAAGVHALHIHEVGVCQAPAFESAGDHLNPTGRAHGMLSGNGPHAGDLPNLHVPAGGAVEAEFFVDGVMLTASSLLDANGSALVLHAKADDHHTDPAGGAGDRIGCGEIKD